MNKPKIIGTTEPLNARKDVLLDEAAAELNARGVTQTSLNDIAARLGVKRTALYYYVEDQRDLVFQCYRRSCEVLAQRFSRARQETETPLDLLDLFIERMLTPDAAQVAVISELSFLDDDRRDTISGLLSGIIADMSSAIESGSKAGLLRPCRSDVIARAVLGLVSWPALLNRSDPELAARVAPNLIAVTKALVRFGVAAKRDRPVPIRLPESAPTNSTLARVFEREVIADAKREALLATGSMLFNAKGVDTTSLDEIAASVGVSKAVIYHNIGDKQTFVLECYRRSQRMAFETAETMEAAETDRLTALASAIYEASLYHLREGGPLLFPMVGFEALPVKVASELREGGVRLLGSYMRTMKAGATEGTLRKQDFETLIAILPSFFQWLTKWHPALSGNRREEEDIAAELAQFVSIGLAPLGAKP